MRVDVSLPHGSRLQVEKVATGHLLQLREHGGVTYRAGEGGSVNIALTTVDLVALAAELDLYLLENSLVHRQPEKKKPWE